MASLIPGFEYDIFISYRQKDNKHDGWVTDFVSSLKGELESTFKEEISVYFDINPHDGILETHDVDASLKEKLKCLIFIPVISHTYCDSNAFAWEHEFKAFITQASLDRFGLKVTLHSGNVASRILPVRIHELDPEDREMVENELGGTLRAIDFIYKEPGVNRPLTPADNENKNLCGTKYRNQINKTANAVKEIISSLQPEQPLTHKERPFKRELRGVPEIEASAAGGAPKKTIWRSRQKFILLVTFLLFMSSLFAIYKFSGNAAGWGRNSEKSIAVLPFENTGENIEDAWLGVALTDEMISQLDKIGELDVKPRNSVMRYKGTAKDLQAIGKEIDVNYILEGTYQKLDDKYRISVRLINSRKNQQLWSDNYDRAWADMTNILGEAAKKTASILKTVLSPEEKAKIEKDPTKSPGAYMNYLSANIMSDDALFYYLVGNKYIDSISFTSAIMMYDKAIEDDPRFALAYAKRSIARSWGYYTGDLDESHIEKCKDDADKAFEIEKGLTEAQIAYGFYYYYCAEDFEKALTCFSIASEMDPGNYQPPFYMAMVYRKMGDWKKSQDLIRKVIEKDPQDALILHNIGLSFSFMHSYDTAVTYFQKAVMVMPGWSGPYISLIETLILKDGNTLEARKALDTLIARTGTRQKYYKILLNIYEGKYHDALKELQSSSDEDFESRGLKYLTTGWIYNLLNDQHAAIIYNDSALIVYKQTIIENPDDCYAYSCSGLVYAGSGNATDAVMAGKTAYQLAGNDVLKKSDMTINLAKIYLLTGDYVNATREVEFLLNNPSGFSTNLLKVDPDWKKLAEAPEFKAMTGKRNGI